MRPVVLCPCSWSFHGDSAEGNVKTRPPRPSLHCPHCLHGAPQTRATGANVSPLTPRAQPGSKFLGWHSECPVTSWFLGPPARVGSLAHRAPPPPRHPRPCPTRSKQPVPLSPSEEQESFVLREENVQLPLGPPSGHWVSLFPRGASVWWSHLLCPVPRPPLPGQGGGPSTGF